jgi:translation elongation factor EF-Tu-like GTPase
VKRDPRRRAGAEHCRNRVSSRIERSGRPPVAAEVAAIEILRNTTTQANAGDHVGLLFPDLTRTDIATGGVIRT